MIDATVCVGFRPRANHGGQARMRTLELLKESFLNRFEHISIASDDAWPHEPFNRSRAKNAAARMAKTLDPDPEQVLVFSDADTYVPEHQVAAAVHAIKADLADVCFAHNGMALYLTHGLMRGMGAGGIAGPFPGGIFAIRRSTFDRVGGFDEKFVGWGHEDLCFFYALDAIFKTRVMMNGSEAMGPVVKLDLLHPRIGHEDDLRADPESPEGQLYAANTRRRDAYFKVASEESYWELRETDIG